MKKGLLVVALYFISMAAFAAPFEGSAESLRQQAIRYEQARGVKQDYDEAYRLYCDAALLGDSEANYNLGWMYFNGRGLPVDTGFAKGWFQRAAKLGDRYAKNMMARFPNVVAKQDENCTLPEPGMITSRAKVEAWVRVIAPKFEIDPVLVMAVISTESAFNPKALSPKNAQGLMQLIPATARRFGVADPWNPLENIIGGVAYLHWLTRHFSGDVKLVLAGYNAGEGAVEKYKGVPPYRETRHYVKRILGRYKKNEHPIPSDIGELREYAVKIMSMYSVDPGIAASKKPANAAI